MSRQVRWPHGETLPGLSMRMLALYRAECIVMCQVLCGERQGYMIEYNGTTNDGKCQ